MRKKISFSSFFMLITVLYAQETSKFNLEQSITHALQNNHKIKAMEYQVNESESGIGVAKSEFYPKITFTETFQRTNNAPQSFFFKLNQRELDMANTDFNYPGTNTDFETKFTVTQPLYMGGKLTAGLEIAKKEKDISVQQHQQTEEEIAYAVAQAYYNLLVAKEYIQVTDLAVKDARDHYRIAQANFEEGRGIKSDMLRAQVYLTQMEENQVKAKTQLEISKKHFALLLGENLDSPIEIEGELVYKPIVVEVNKSIETGLDNRIEIKELKLRKEQIHHQKSATVAEFLPTLGLVGIYQWNSEDAPFGTDADSWYGGMVLSYPIFDGGARYSKIHSVNASSRKLDEMLEDTKKNVIFQITKSILELDETQKRVELRKHSVTQAEETLRLTEIRYENGMATMIELTDTQTALNQARLAAIQSISDYNMALLSIDYYKGILVKKFLEKERE